MLFYPVRPYAINQPFGVNGAYYQAHGINILGHNGLDLRAAHGQPVWAAHDGMAYFETDSNQGEGVVIVSSDTFDYKNGQVFFKSVYWHLCDYAKEPKFKSPVLDWQQKNGGKGMAVKRGDVIGYADSTGLSTGDHLHFSIKPVALAASVVAEDAADDLRIGMYQNVEGSNGYTGAIDPTPYFNGQYADEKDEPLSPADQVAVIAATEQAEGNKTLADQLWAIVAMIKAFLGVNN